MSKISLNAIKCVQNDKFFYVTIVKSDLLKKMCFVSRKKEDSIKGFQRLLNYKRAKDIAFYLDTSKGVIPSAIIVSAQKSANLEFDGKKQQLILDDEDDSLLVIDGQHRLFGLLEAKGTYEFPVIIFNCLNTSEEVRLFIDINTTQKGVPSSLILDIKSQAGTETSIEELQRTLFSKLNEDSVLAGYFLPNESKVGKISRVVFNNSTKSLFVNSPSKDWSLDLIYKSVKNYLESVDRIFKETSNSDARLNKTIIFKAIMHLFNDACEDCLREYRNLKTESFYSFLIPLKSLDYSKYTGTNKATETQVINDMRSVLREKVSIEEDMF